MIRKVFIGIFAAVLMSCATTADDPLQNTKKLAKQGHASLYNNGAFQVPNTEIRLIPAGPSAYEFAAQLAGMDARESFVTSVQNAADAVSLVADGTKKSFAVAGTIINKSNEIADEISSRSREGSKLLIYNNSSLTKSIIGQSWRAAASSWDGVYRFGEALSQESSSYGKSIRDRGADVGKLMIGGSLSGAKSISEKSYELSKEGLQFAGNRFVEGYMTLPQKGKERLQNIADAVDVDDFKSGVTEPLAWAAKTNKRLSSILIDTGKNYFSNIGDAFGDASDALDNYHEDGTFALVKAMGHVLKGIFWDGVIEPVGRITAASLGLVGTNLGALPVMVVVREGMTTAELAIEVTWNTLAFGYDIVAPTVISATAATLSVAAGVAGQGVAAVTAVGGSTLGATEYGLSQIAGGAVSVGGQATGKVVQYVGVPLTAAGIAVTGTAVGATVGVATDVGKIAAGGTLFVAGETAALGTKAFGVVLGGTTAVVGTTGSVVAGAGLGVFELAKAVVVPVGYELTSGVVLGYTAASQLAAHTILGVADASYMVLSLEGPRWVIYAVKGDLGDGHELEPGTVLNLKTMQQQGETFYYLPVSEPEMRSVIEALPSDIPHNPTPLTDNNN